MPETFDLQGRFDDLVSDVTRAAGPGDARVPPRRARNRRRLAGAVAAVVVATVGITTLQVVGDDAPDSAPDIADRNGQVSPGQERRERLLGLLPADSRQVSVVDLEGLTGEPGFDPAAPEAEGLAGYMNVGFVVLDRGPLPSLVLPDLVTYAGTGATDVFLVDRPPAEVTDGLRQAGWSAEAGVLTPGPGVPRLTARLAANVRVIDEQGQALVVVAARRTDLPPAGAPDAEPGVAAAPLVELGGAVGIGLDFGGPCALDAVSLVSPTEGSVLVDPPEGMAPEDVTVDDLIAPEGISSLESVSVVGDSVRVQVTTADLTGPMQVVSRLGLPGTEFC